VHKKSIAISDPAVSLSQMNIFGFLRKYLMMAGQGGVKKSAIIFTLLGLHPVEPLQGINSDHDLPFPIF